MACGKKLFAHPGRHLVHYRSITSRTSRLSVLHDVFGSLGDVTVSNVWQGGEGATMIFLLSWTNAICQGALNSCRGKPVGFDWVWFRFMFWWITLTLASKKEDSFCSLDSWNVSVSSPCSLNFSDDQQNDCWLYIGRILTCFTSFGLWRIF